MEKRNIIIIAAVAATLALAGAAVGTVYAVTSNRSNALDNALINTTTTVDPTDPSDPSDPEEPTDPETPEEPGDPETPETPSDPEDPSDPEEPDTPEDPSDPEEPEIPSIDPSVIYDFATIKNLLMQYEELNGSYCIMRVKVAGEALGVPGYFFFHDANEETIKSRQDINNNMTNFLAREDNGNNNVNLNRGDIITISGTVTWGRNSYLGCDLVTIH